MGLLIINHDYLTYQESPEVSPGLICGEMHLSEHKIDQICKTLVLSVGQGPISGNCLIINMAKPSAYVDLLLCTLFPHINSVLHIAPT